MQFRAKSKPPRHIYINPRARYERRFAFFRKVKDVYSTGMVWVIFEHYHVIQRLERRYHCLWECWGTEWFDYETVSIEKK